MNNDGRATRGATEDLDTEFDAGLYANGVTFDEDDVSLLRAIKSAGSLNGAVERLDRSYSREHKRINTLESVFGTLVDPERGGSTGGGSEITPRAQRLIARFERLKTEFSGVSTVDETVFDGCVVGRDGELGRVWTLAGELRAIVPPDAPKVQVTIRADTVTLHDPTNAPTDSATSARNQFHGTVETLDQGEEVVTVGIDIGAPQLLMALVTRHSAETLALESGSEIVASFKTTATRATPRMHPANE